MTAAGSAGEAVTPGQAALKLAFENWLGSQGYDEDGMFDADEMEFAFEAGAEAERDLAQAAIAAQQPQPEAGVTLGWPAADALGSYEIRCSCRSWNFTGTVSEISAAGRGHDDSPSGKHIVSIAHGGRRVDEPVEQPAPELAAATPPLGTAWRLLDETRDRLAATKLVLQETSRESSQRGEQLGKLRDGIAALIDGLKTTAAATHPSKKSEIEFALIRKLRAILEAS